MPTKKPRIMVTLSEEDYELVRRVARAQGSSASALLREYVEMSRPMLEHMAGLADTLEKAIAERREIHVEAVERAMDKGQALFDIMSGQMSLAVDWLETIGDAATGQGVAVSELLPPGGVAQTPQLSNRGVRFLSLPEKPEEGSAE